MVARQDVPTGAAGGAPSPMVRAAVADGLRHARGALERRHYREAQQFYEGVLSMEPGNIEALHLLGFVLLKTGDPVRAEALIARALSHAPRPVWAIANHGAALVLLARHQDALRVLDHALSMEPDFAPAHISRADAMAALGYHDEALGIYDQVLAKTPTIPDAWLGRGKALAAHGRLADAVLCFDRVLQLEAAHAEAYICRGHALRDYGRRADALQSYRLALVIRPDSPNLLSMCAGVLLDMGRAADALAYIESALAKRPNEAAYLFQSCVALDHLHFHEQLLERTARLLLLAPNGAPVWLARGNALQGLHRHAEAADAYRRALELEPDMVDALRNRAAALRLEGGNTEALEHYERALAISGPDVELLYNQAAVLQQLGRYEEALCAYDAMTRAPAQTAQTRYTLAVGLQQLGRHEEALRSYEQACELEPGHAAARRSQAFCRLLMGDFERGWEQQESRWLTGETLMRRRHADRPLWRGKEPVAGKTVLLHAEQGYGDTLQFCRYASLLADRGAAVVLEVPQALKALLSTLRGVRQLVSENETTPAFDLQCPLLSLPLAFGTGISTIPASIPYLHADPGRVSQWAARLAQDDPTGRLRVGIAWSGNPRHNNDANRSMALADLAPLYRMNAVFVNLQPLVRERDAETLDASPIVDYGRGLNDFAETAALVSVLDLVITVDTSVAHLAGALGRSVWILLPYIPDWRWLLERGDSPWYPTAKLFRQNRPGDWAAPVERIAHTVSEIIATRAGQGRSP